MSIVRYERGKLPKTTKADIAELKALAEMPDSEIDYSDLPPLDDEFFRNAIPNPFYKPIKQAKTLRIDKDVLNWFMRKGKGYQAKINQALRDTMLRELQQGVN